MKFSRSVGAFEVPHTATALLLGVNIVVYALVLQRSGTSVPSSAALFRSGAIYSGALARHEYWRLVAYAFLHVSMLHILTNMACLVWWGGPLEKRIGTAYFLLIYFASVIAGALFGIFTSPGLYLSVGASAGISGILGALLCLKLLKRIDLPASFFVINLGLNVLVAFIGRVDWRAHLGGILAGMVVCAVIDAFEVTGPKLMRCKFPEFVKLNLGILFAVVAWLTDFSPVAMLLVLAVLIVAVKGIDVALSLPRGLALTVAMLAAGNALVMGAVVILTLPETTGDILLPANLVPWAASSLRSLIEAAAAVPVITTLIVVVAVLGLTPLVYWPELTRGLNDRGGFVAASFRAERGRRRGL
ncbi:rhomboid family intramembrane serine protease [Bradyrhizobium sp.]|uniref:rhomboid family intramembrane serine protease n=1 Tax=Bradyrhizobium sp. TaxID=376 RepID=UPI002D6DFF4A|nr:rhomboid family intramembrane serine protease [Bradyrhizobium sp.]HZR75692.1 rhomboid family intramembrane serine protease [Bradyrhizobium sp.]